MVETNNLDEALKDISALLPEEIIEKYQDTTFKSPSSLERSAQSFVKDDTVAFTINYYAEFLDEGTRFIKAQPFITPILEDDDNLIEETLTIGFEQDIYDTIEKTISQGGGKLS